MAKRTWLAYLLLPGMLALPPAAAADRDLRLEVDPARGLPVGERSCVALKTLDRGAGPVGARVVINGARSRTGPDGRVRACTTFRWGGRHLIHAYRRGAHAFKPVRTIRGSGVGRERWVPFSFGTWSDPRSARCGQQRGTAPTPIWGEDHAVCLAGAFATVAGREGIPGPGVLNFDGSSPIWFLFAGHPRFDDGHGQYFSGHAPDASSTQFFVDFIEVFRGQCEFEGGSDPDLIGRPGGPARLKLTPEREGGRVVGYEFRMDGYVFERAECEVLG